MLRNHLKERGDGRGTRVLGSARGAPFPSRVTFHRWFIGDMVIPVVFLSLILYWIPSVVINIFLINKTTFSEHHTTYFT